MDWKGFEKLVLLVKESKTGGSGSALAAGLAAMALS